MKELESFESIRKYCSCVRMIELIFNIETYKLQNNPSTSIRKRSSARVFRRKIEAAVNEATEIIESDLDILSNPIEDFQFIMSDVDQESNLMRHWEIHATYQDEPNVHLIHIAAYCDCDELVKLFLDKFPTLARIELKSDHYKGQIPLYSAALNKHTKNVSLLLEAFPEGITRKDEDGKLIVHKTAEFESIEMTKLLLKAYPAGAGETFEDGRYTMLQCVAASGNMELSRVILDEYPPSAYVKDRNGWSPIHTCVAIMVPQWEIARLILSRSRFHGLFVPFNSTYFLTPWDKIRDYHGERENMFDFLEGAEEYPLLANAIGNVSADDVCFIAVKLTTDIYMKNEEGKTALMVAFQKARTRPQHWENYYRVIILLVYILMCPRTEDEGDIAEILDYDNRNVLHHAAEGGLPWDHTKTIVDANRAALCHFDLEVTGLLPFMMSAEGSNYDLSSCFEMLRLRPDVLEVVNEMYSQDLYGPYYGIQSDAKRRRVR